MVFCWPGQEANARRIATSLAGHVHRLTVIGASAAAIEHVAGCDWVKVDPADYYGRKFQAAIARFEGDVLLQIQADASVSSWPALAARCADSYASDPDLGMWAPDVDHTDWKTDEICLEPSEDRERLVVAQTDCIVWSMTSRVVARMRELDYSENNLGWGIDWAAVAFCYVSGLSVVRDLAIRVDHPSYRGYSADAAEQQMRDFLLQLEDDERARMAVLEAAIEDQRAGKRLRKGE